MSSRWARRSLIAAAIVVIVGAGAGAGAIVGVRTLSGDGSHRSVAGRAGPTTSGTTVPVPPKPATATAKAKSKAKARRSAQTVVVPAPLPKTGWVATLHRTITYSAKPGGPPVGPVNAKDPYGQVNVLGVVGAPRADGWAEVELPVRPDGSTAWIRTRAVALTRTAWWIKVDLSARQITVGDGRRKVLTSSVAVGSPSTPTPVAHTYVWESLRPSDPAGPYGPYILGLALYSKVLATFGDGGPAQIGIHGNDEPSSIGLAVSNGCVRMPNTLVTRLVRTIPLGTPVTISD
jgi:lipoprotein-anchoring transpeptidase ErfK/SrfK